FYFSSRRRHTRWPRDWSSDVCSSDLPAGPVTDGRVALTLTADRSTDLRPEIFGLAKARGWTLYELHQAAGSLEDLFHQLTSEPRSEERRVGKECGARGAGRGETKTQR